jgi:uncharacterized protein
MKNCSITCVNPSTEPEPSELTPLARPLIAVITFYQRVTAGRVSACRFYPSCSSYAKEALATHGALRGGALALRRISRCRPLGPHGVDLVPVPTHTRSQR